jgi:uncharacterized protein YbcI
MSPPTIGQLEREISQRIRSLYYEKTGHNPSQIICHFFNSQMVISIENSVTQVEKSLLDGGYENLAEEVRLFLDKIIKLQLKSLITEIIGKPIIDLMINTNLASLRTGVVIVLAQLPEVRNPESIPKSNIKNLGD